MKYGSMTLGAYLMTEPKLSIVQEKGQVTIPAEIRRKLGLKKGDLVAFVETENGVLISPREVVALDALRRLGESLKAKGITLEELMESGREIRGELLEEMYGLDASTDVDK
jgi:AbrB family looped-hinge helix DNA binding protein